MHLTLGLLVVLAQLGATSLPAYRMEPPDIIQIEMPKRAADAQPVTGQYLIGPDGTVNLRKYGVVHVAGKTVSEAQVAIQNHLKKFLDAPEVSVKVVAYNSHVYYILTQRAGMDYALRLPATGNETVLDAIAQVKGLSDVSSKKIWVSRPDPDQFGKSQILPVDWNAIRQGDQPSKNFQILPGDRLFIVDAESSPTSESSPKSNGVERSYVMSRSYDAEPVPCFSRHLRRGHLRRRIEPGEQCRCPGHGPASHCSPTKI